MSIEALVHWLAEYNLPIAWAGVALQLGLLASNGLMLRRWGGSLKAHAKSLAEWSHKLQQASAIFRTQHEVFLREVEQFNENELLFDAKCRALGVVLAVEKVEKVEIPHDFKPPTRH